MSQHGVVSAGLCWPLPYQPQVCVCVCAMLTQDTQAPWVEPPSEAYTAAIMERSCVCLLYSTVCLSVRHATNAPELYEPGWHQCHTAARNKGSHPEPVLGGRQPGQQQQPASYMQGHQAVPHDPVPVDNLQAGGGNTHRSSSVRHASSCTAFGRPNGFCSFNYHDAACQPAVPVAPTLNNTATAVTTPCSSPIPASMPLQYTPFSTGKRCSACCLPGGMGVPGCSMPPPSTHLLQPPATPAPRTQAWT